MVPSCKFPTCWRRLTVVGCCGCWELPHPAEKKRTEKKKHTNQQNSSGFFFFQSRAACAAPVAPSHRGGNMSLLLQNEFHPLPPDRSVNTKLFLDAVSHLPSFFDCLGSNVFGIIKSDINGNIMKIKAVYVKDPEKYVTLQDIVEGEREDQAAQWPKVGATLALMWLKRGLRFIQILLQSLVDGERDESNPNLIRVNIIKAYEQALKKYHGWLVQNIFKVALCAAPYRSNFLQALSRGEEVKEEECLANMRQFLVNYSPTVDAIYEMYSRLNAELDYTV